MTAPGSARGAIEYAPSPSTHLWVALCLGMAGAALGASAALGLGEVLISTRTYVLEALLLASS